MNSANGLPRFTAAAGRMPRRSDFIDGLYRTYFAPGQTPECILNYQPPTDWPKALSLLRMPAVLWVTLDFGKVTPIQQATPGQDDGSYLLYQIFENTLTSFPDQDFIYPAIGTYGDTTVHQHAYYSFPDVNSVLLDSISTPPTRTKIDPYIIYFRNPIRDRYTTIKNDLLDLITSVYAASGGKVMTTLIDKSMVQRSDTTPEPDHNSANFEGMEVIDGTGATILSLFNRTVPTGDSTYAIAELLGPKTFVDFLGTNFLHVFVGLPDYWVPSEDFDTERLPASVSNRVASSQLINTVPKFYNYRCLIYGLEDYTFPNMVKGTEGPPVHQFRHDVPESEPVIFSDRVDIITTVGEPDEAGQYHYFHSELFPSSAMSPTHIEYINRQPTQAVMDSHYAAALVQYNNVNTNCRSDAPDTETISNADQRAILQGEANLLTAYGFTYMGDTTAFSISDILTVIRECFPIIATSI